MPRGNSQWKLLSRDCPASLTVLAPARLAVEAYSGSGDMKLAGLDGNLTLKEGSGDIRLERVSGEVNAKSGSGSMEGTLRSSRASMMTGSGDLKLAWERSPAEGDIEIKTGSGDADLAFPPDAALRASVLSASGSFKNEFGESAQAKLNVSVMSGSGDISLRKAAVQAAVK